MVSFAKTSSSSLSSIPCKANPNVTKSELSDPMRRSFSGNPFTPRAFNPNTPVNSPSGLLRRHSTGREGVVALRDPDKENSKDQNPKAIRLRSPASSKGTKNFMASTISAVSKINASPGKKTLVERNEPARSTIPFSDVNRSTPDIATKRKVLLFSCDDNESTPYIGLNQKLSFFDVKSIIMEDSESTQQTDSKLNNVKVPRGYKESLKSSADSLKEALTEEKGSVKVEPTPEIAFKPKTVSFSDVRSLIMEYNESTQQTGLKQNNVEGPHEYKEPLKSKAVLLMENLPEEKGSVKVIPRFEISPKVSILAPLDADPLMIPYDPRTNYLSPRPQFLHYRPNPRIYIYRERDRKQLEECFATERYSDTDLTEETQPEDPQREPEDLSSEETNPIAAGMIEESFEAKEMNKPRFSTRSKFIALLMVLAFAYFSVLAANTPAFTSSRLEELSLLNFRVPPEVIGFAKAKIEVLTESSALVG